MKKISLFFLALITFGCNPDPDAQVKDIFKSYVKENFDNPKDLESVVKIGEPRFICIDSAFNDAKNIISLYDSTRKDANKLNETIFTELNRKIDCDDYVVYYIKSHRNDYYVDYLLTTLMNDAKTELKRANSAKKSSRELIEEILDDSLCVYHSFEVRTIKYRVKFGDSYKLDSVFYIVMDSCKTYISKEDIKTADLGGGTKDLMELLSGPMMDDLSYEIERFKKLKDASLAWKQIKRDAKK